MNRADHDVAKPCRRNRRHLRRSFPALQPRPLEPHGCLLLVGLGSDLRTDRDPFGLGNPRLVSARPAGEADGGRHRPLLYVGQPDGHQARHADGDPDRHGISGPRVPLGDHPRLLGQRRLDAVVHVGPYDPVQWRVRLVHKRVRGAISDRLCCTCVRSSRLSRRRNGQRQQERSACDVCRRRDGERLLPLPAGDLAGRDRAVRDRWRPRHHTRADLRTALRRARKVARDLVHGLQHVPRLPAAACRCLPDAVTALRRTHCFRGRSPGATAGMRRGLRPPSPPSWRSSSCSPATQPG